MRGWSSVHEISAFGNFEDFEAYTNKGFHAHFGEAFWKG